MSTLHYAPQDIQQAIDHGPMTAAYTADRELVIPALNRLRSTEITSYLQV